MILLESDLTRVPERWKRELIRGEDARAVLTVKRQAAIAEAAKEIQYVHIDGIGERKLIPLDHDLVWRMRTRHGLDCLHDPAFVRSLWEKNPMLRANCRARNFTIRVNGLRGEPGNVQRSTSNVQRSIPDVRKHEESAGRTQGHGAQRPAIRPARTGDPATPLKSGHETAAAGASLVLP